MRKQYDIAVGIRGGERSRPERGRIGRSERIGRAERVRRGGPLGCPGGSRPDRPDGLHRA